MKRIQLFEFEDFEWFPKSIRSSMTNLIVIFHKMTGTKEVVTNILKPILTELEVDQIVDMGAGSGGIMPSVIGEINEAREKKVNLLLTDLHPNQAVVDRINSGNDNLIRYRSESFNACHMQEAPNGLKTMMNSFHHMPRKLAGKILKNAEEAKQPILIYEMGQNNIPLIIWWLFLPLSLIILFVMTLFMTPFVRPMTWQQLVFTYLIPIIPICYAWDGQASLVRMYTFNDVQTLLSENEVGQNVDGYQWTVDHAYKLNGKKMGYYIYGSQKNKN